MIMRIFLAVIAAVLSVTLINMYLSPDDLRNCGSSPGSNSEMIACQKADVIVAVSGGDTEARTREAISLYKRGWADKLLFSGAAADKSGPSNAQTMRQLALSSGVPSENIIIEENSNTTQENARLTSEIFKLNNISRAILVTSAYHQRRASIEFKHSLGSSVSIINHPVSEDKQWTRLWWATPNGWWLAMGEIIKITVAYLGVSR